MARSRSTSRRPSPRVRARRRRARRTALAAGARSVGQMLAVGVGGAVAGGLLVAAALPGATEPVPPIGSVGLAVAVGVATLAAARRLRPPPPQSGRGRR